MRQALSWLIAALTLTLLVSMPVAYAQEEKVSLENVPKPVLESVKGRFAGAKLTGASKETEDGKLIYEVTIKHEGQNIDVTLAPEGDIALIEKEIPSKALPGPVAKALEHQYPKATYKIVEEIFRVEQKQETFAYYEVLLETPRKTALEVQLTTDGKIVNEEKKGSAKDR